MKTLKGKDPIITAAFYADLFDGTISPEQMVSSRDARRVRKAMKVIGEFKKTMKEDELLDEI